MSDAAALHLIRTEDGALRWSSDADPGIRRTGRTRFRYVDETTSSVVRDRRTLERIGALAIPPAWDRVWICADDAGHLQSTGRDAKARKQYRYHARFRAHREAEKFRDLPGFGAALGGLRKHLDEELHVSGRWTRERTLALSLAVLDRTLVRVGNDAYAKANGSFGLTTLRRNHLVEVDGDTALRFIGKAGKKQLVTLDDPELARLLRRCSHLPGQQLLQWVDDDDVTHPIRSSDINDHLKELTGADFTAKTFRTWGATVRAATLLAAEPEPSSQRAAARTTNEALDEVASALGNTRAVCRAHYVHPGLITAYEAGTLAEAWAAGPNRPAAGLTTEERRTLACLPLLEAGVPTRRASKRAAA